MRQSGEPTKYPGVYKVSKGTYRVRGKQVNPRTGKSKEVDRIVEVRTVREAVRKRADLLEAMQDPIASGQRVRVGDYATSWLRSKALKIDVGTAERYAEALENHILPALGDLFYDALTRYDVQKWVDSALTEEVVMPGGKKRVYAVRTVHGWFRVLRAMTRDAMVELDLPRDPTLRISFPQAPDPEEPNALSPEELTRFLGAMREHYPQHYALTVILGYTGLRFCHASALQWEDWNEKQGKLRIVRKQVRGRVGPVTRKKQAPREYPVEPGISLVLQQHRGWLAVHNPAGLAAGWMFPSKTGTLRSPSGLKRAKTAAAMNKLIPPTSS